jgi:hypothetical protein
MTVEQELMVGLTVREARALRNCAVLLAAAIESELEWPGLPNIGRPWETGAEKLEAVLLEAGEDPGVTL